MMSTSNPSLARRWVWALMPLLLLIVLVAVLVRFGPLGVFIKAFPPVEELTIDRVSLAPQMMAVHLTNGGPQPVTVAQVIVDEAYWEFSMSPGHTVPRLGQAIIAVPYPWVEGETHHLKLVSSTGLTFEHTIEVATATPTVDARYLATFTLLGIYVGVIPVLLGLLWFPFLRQLDQRWIAFFLSLTAGLLLFLGVEAVHDALETAGTLPPAFQGVGLVLVGLVITVLILVAVSRRVTSGAGAIFQVVYELLKLMIGERPALGYQVAGFAAGLLVMYITGLFVAA